MACRAREIAFYSSGCDSGMFDSKNVRAESTADNNHIRSLNKQSKHFQHSLQSSTLHLKVELHPFFDGNGRTSRLLLDYMIDAFDLPSAFVPTELEWRNEYYKTLSKASRGSKRTFIKFMIRVFDNNLKVVHCLFL